LGKSPKVEVSPFILRKLRENSGYSVEELAKKLGVSEKKIEDVESSKDSFTITQLKSLAKIYKIPLAAFFSEDIPHIPSLPDYRINRDKKLNPEAFVAIRRAKYLSDMIVELSGKKSKFPTFPENLPPDELARIFRRYLGIGEIPKLKDSYRTLEFYKNLIEEKLGILIIEYPLKNDNVRAFSLKRDLAVIVLNESDEPKVKLFSLFHEIAHLLKGSEGICEIDVDSEKFEIERFCDKFAAEFLVPASDLKLEIEKKAKRELSDDIISELARRYGVSKHVMMLRLLNLGYITKDRYRRFKESFDKAKLEELKKKKVSGSRNWERTYFNRAGRLAIREVSRAYERGEISFFEASRILNMKIKYAERLLG